MCSGPCFRRPYRGARHVGITPHPTVQTDTPPAAAGRSRPAGRRTAAAGRVARAGRRRARGGTRGRDRDLHRRLQRPRGQRGRRLQMGLRNR
ncbi:hypothetical protein SCOCK_480037 [Actinacidiphila cocklensis]|uniref:Uncharacterized protein n=1 Tax=Actinacidiphila cocklensis TaxID=887465 RepID=A0A9W4GTC1_9ACTN|nr:hypothetical protein SCOCK_480037 [Actinacidiphila cocklensis]